MIRTWHMIGVADVAKSSAWYMRLLDAQETHPGGTTFNQIMDNDGTVALALHWWGPTGKHGDHHWPSLSSPEHGTAWNGLLLWFLVTDFDSAWERAVAMNATIDEEPNTDNGTHLRAFVVRDPDGYYVTLNEMSAAA